VIPRGEVPADIGQRVRSAVPVLLLNGGADPAEPPGNVANARRELPNGLTAILPGQGHGQLGLGCVDTLIARFIAAGTARPGYSVCTAGAAAAV
jgi:pimeloyl-ACP methyl ester carboxylesterase